MSFPCTSCGACCRDVKIFDSFPQFRGILAYREDGSCVNLTEDNLCSIYETRPQMCRIPQGLSRQLTKGTADQCNHLQEKYGIGEEYRVIIEDNKSY
jgi:Fe-S-cluster containining protein